MSAPFKFRFVTQLTGFFVVGCMGLLIASIFVAGKKQNWFEPKYTFMAVAHGEEGAHGLRPGSVVQLSRTPIGKVTSVDLVAIDNTRVEISIQERYKGFIDSHSRLIVRKMYQLAGNASVEIVPGEDGGSPLVEGDVLAITSDQELMETAREFLEEAKNIGLPIIEKFDDLLENLNVLTQSINDGKGPVGHLLHDDEWSAEVSGMLTNLNHASTQISPMLTRADDFSRRAVIVAQNLESISSNADKVSDDLVHVSGALKKESQHLDGLLLQVQQTLVEIERLTKGVQKHWLVRKHIDQDPDVGPMLNPLGMRMLKHQVDDGGVFLLHVPGALKPMALSAATAKYSADIQHAEAIDDNRQLGVNQYNYGACLYSAGDVEMSIDVLDRASLEFKKGTSYARSLIMKAVVLKDESRYVDSRKALKSAEFALKGKRERVLDDLIQLLLAECWVADGESKRAGDIVDRLKRRVDDDDHDSTFRVAYYRLAAQLESSQSRKAVAYDEVVRAVRASENYALLPEALAQSGQAWGEADNSSKSLDRYYRSARSAWSQGREKRARQSLVSAQKVAENLDDPLVDQVKALAERMQQETSTN